MLSDSLRWLKDVAKMWEKGGWEIGQEKFMLGQKMHGR
jgi:hypothetical protein